MCGAVSGCRARARRARGEAAQARRGHAWGAGAGPRLNFNSPHNLPREESLVAGNCGRPRAARGGAPRWPPASRALALKRATPLGHPTRRERAPGARLVVPTSVGATDRPGGAAGGVEAMLQFTYGCSRAGEQWQGRDLGASSRLRPCQPLACGMSGSELHQPNARPLSSPRGHPPPQVPAASPTAFRPRPSPLAPHKRSCQRCPPSRPYKRRPTPHAPPRARARAPLGSRDDDGAHASRPRRGGGRPRAAPGGGPAG